MSELPDHAHTRRGGVCAHTCWVNTCLVNQYQCTKFRVLSCGPHFSSEFVASNNTVATVTYDDWLTRDGPVSHQVEMIVTPKVIVSCYCMWHTNGKYC